MKGPLKNIVVVGASYVGLRTAQEIARICPETYRVLLIERNTHFNHLFTFPRFAVLSGHEHKAFMPFNGVFSGISETGTHHVINAAVTKVEVNHICIDREWGNSSKISFDYLAIATGTQLREPAMMPTRDKESSVQYLQKHQRQVEKASNIVLVGAGAVGVQMATDLKDLYPEKSVTLILSRNRVMNRFSSELHEAVCRRLEQLGVRLILGSRVNIPHGGFPHDGSNISVKLSDGTSVNSDLAISSTRQKPNSHILDSLSNTHGSPLINPSNGFIRVRPTMQLCHPGYSHIFAVGDVADTKAPKAARPGYAQAEVAAKNIKLIIDGQAANTELQLAPAGIHLSLGLRYNVLFRNPQVPQTQAHFRENYDGSDDLNVERMWQRLNVSPQDKDQFNL